MVDTDGPDLHGAELVRWPGQAELRRHLARAGIPRLLVVDADVAPPVGLHADEEWLRGPGSAAEVEARAAALVQRLRRRGSCSVSIESGGLLRRGDATVVLSESEAVVARLLLDARGAVVARRVIEAHVWPSDRRPGPRALDAVVQRLRRRLEGLGVLVETVRSRGVRLRLA